jgi:ABC-type Fe3+-hydroxamate transport system, periplasmic component
MRLPLSCSSLCLFALCLAVLCLSFFSPIVVENPSGEASYSLHDMTGKEIRLPGPARSTLILTPVAWDYLTVDNTDAHIMAVSPWIREQAEKNLLGRIFPAFLTKGTTVTAFGNGMPGFEQIMFMRPDATVIWEWFAEPYEAVHFPGLIRLTSYREGKQELFALLGELTGKADRAKFLFTRHDKEIAHLHHNTLTGKEPTRIAVIYGNGFTLWGDYFKDFNTNLKALNAINVGESIAVPRQELSIEVLLLLDPEVIFLVDNGITMSVEEMYSLPSLRGLRAVKDRRLYRMPEGASRMEGPVERPLLYAWIDRLINSERFPDLGMRGLVGKTYLDIYGYAMSEGDLDDWFQTGDNRHSRHYAEIVR